MVNDLIWLWDENDCLRLLPVKLPHILLLDNSAHTFRATFKLDSITIYLVRQSRKSQLRHSELFSQLHKTLTTTAASFKPSKYYEVPLLKSAMQKAIRRGYYSQTKAIVKQMLSQDLTATLRRIPILPIEDVKYMPWWSHAVWLMAAESKGYHVDSLTKISLIHLLGDLAVFNEPNLFASRYQGIDHPSLTRNSDIPLCRHHLTKAWDKKSNQSVLAVLHFATAVRIAYGGMKGDQHLLNVQMHHYIETYLPSHSNEISKEGLSFYDYVGESISRTDSSLPSFDLNIHKIPEAADFHCTNIVRDVRNVVEVDNVELRKAIWFLRSNSNFRNLEKFQMDATSASLLTTPTIIPPDYPVPPWWKEVERILNESHSKYWIAISPPPKKKRNLNAIFQKEDEGNLKRSTLKQSTLLRFCHVC